MNNAKKHPQVGPEYDSLLDYQRKAVKLYKKYMRRFTSTVPARGARALNRAISNSCL